MLEDKNPANEEREAILYLITTLVIGDEGDVEVFSQRAKEAASDLWIKLEMDGYITPKEKLNRLLDLLVEKSLQAHVFSKDI